LGFALDWMGLELARYLSAPGRRGTQIAIDPPEAVAEALRPGDVLLVDGNTRIATAIKYLTQSTWSHAALYPILPEVMLEKLDDPACSDCYREILHVRHHSLIAPRDFDISPYFAIIKPAHSGVFDFTALAWPKGGDYLRAWAS
jgi:hypothetical protein